MLYKIHYKSLKTGHTWQSGGAFEYKKAEQIMKDVQANNREHGYKIESWIAPAGAQPEDQ